MCEGKGALGTFGPCEVFPQGTHFKQNCPLCLGKCYLAYGVHPVKCHKCGGKGGMGAFGPCEPTNVHFKSSCVECAGKGYK